MKKQIYVYVKKFLIKFQQYNTLQKQKQNTWAVHVF